MDGPGDDPDFLPDKPPDYEPARTRRAWTRSPASTPFIVHPDGLGWLFAPAGLVDGPLPVHYEPHESPFENALYGQDRTRRASPSTARTTLYNPDASRPDVFPFVLTTYRLTEHHTAGGCRDRPVPRGAPARALLSRSRRRWRPSAVSSTGAGPRSSPRARRSRRA